MRQQVRFLTLLFLAFTHPPCFGQTAENLTLAEAEKIAVQNHPQIQVATYLASAASARVQQARSAYYPQAYGSMTGVDAENNSRVAAGALNNPIIFERYSNGVTVGQLLTDFGRTHELVKSSSYHAQARQEDVVATRADVLLQVDQAYFAVLKAQTVLQVAEKTVSTRQLVADQVSALAKNKLRSGLDVSFANVDLAQAQLLLVQAQNDLQASSADLSTALGYSAPRTFHLSEEPVSAAPPADLAALLQQALQNRPELISQRLDVNSAKSYATAERDLWFPTITAVGTAGLTPYGADQLAPRYAAAGFNVNIPLFNGHLYGALRSEADAQAQAQQQYLRTLQDRVVRDVQKAWLNAISDYQRLSLTDQLLKNATEALDLAQERYKLGLSSIIELSQAQLNETQAEIAQAGAKYDYEAQLSALNYQVGRMP
ncbi:MAG TPA: TolC family protein [Candidatus Limnocylindria bacterium]|nr:TolC family protein [Candidatus Limnocylindria bacterium]